MAFGKRGKYSRAQARARIRRTKRRKGSMGWTVATGMVVVVGVAAIVLVRAGNSAAIGPVVNKDHWHAYLGINVCGEWLPNAPAFDTPTAKQMGIHSHGDGLMHIHPYSSAAAGKHATVARFIQDNDDATWSLSESSMKLWDDVEHKNGQVCTTGTMKGKKARIVWATGHYGKQWTGKLRSGDPAGYRPQDGDIVAIGFMPTGEKLPEPPGASATLATVSDPGATPPSTSGSATTTSTTLPASTPAGSTPAP